MRLDDAQFAQLMALLDEVVAEYEADRARFGPEDLFEVAAYLHRKTTAERIRTEIIVRSGRLPEGSTF